MLRSAQQPWRLFLPVVANETGSVQAAAIDATQTIITKYYYFGAQRVAMASDNPSLAAFRYLHWDHLGSAVAETSTGAARMHKQGYYAFGAYRDVGGDEVITEHKFTGQKLDGSGLYYYYARYYDPAIGQFVSPDSIVPDPENVLAYNRYMYALGNPLTYSDPSGYYTNDEIMQHYGCEGWACVESHFGSGGSHDGLWGWLYTLQQAQDGYQVHASSFSGSIGMTQFSGVFDRGANGTIGVQGTNFSAQVGNEGIKTFNISTGSGVKHNYLSFDPSKVDKLGLGLAALSAGTDAGPMIMAASLGTGPAAPFVFAAGLGYTGVGLATDLVVDVVIPIREAINGNTGPAVESISVGSMAVGLDRLGGKVGQRVAPFVGPTYNVGKAVAPEICYGTGCAQ